MLQTHLLQFSDFSVFYLCLDVNKNTITIFILQEMSEYYIVLQPNMWMQISTEVENIKFDGILTLNFGPYLITLSSQASLR